MKELRDYDYIYSRLYDVFEVQGREEETRIHLDNLINDYGFKKASQFVMEKYYKFFNFD